MSGIDKNIQIGVGYYQAVQQKDIQTMASLFHEAIELVGPLGNVSGKHAVLQAATNFASAVQNLSIREKFGIHDHVMIIYDVQIANQNEMLRTASLLTIKSALIIRIELFFDASAFGK